MTAPEQAAPKTPALSAALNRVPEKCHHIHLMGICGTGMASLAGLLKDKGYQITGSDQKMYPPMSEFLQALSIPVMEGYEPGNLFPRPDLVIVGNVITRDNPEALELARLALPYLSFPQALRHFALRDKRSIVVSGTHGKTTTASLAAWILEKGGQDPGFMIGGLPLDFQCGFKRGQSPFFIIEGDEYDTAFFDKRPKFLHYNPWITIITSIEFDHADIYRDLDHVIGSFRRLVDITPRDGLIIGNGDDEKVLGEITAAKSRVVTYGLSPEAHWRAANISAEAGLTRLKVYKEGKEHLTLTTRLYGRHNISNLLASLALADFLGIPDSKVAEALGRFQGVKRRQEIVGESNGILILDDFAHHPTAVRETLRAVKEKYGERRLVAVFEPRSNSSRRGVFQSAYAASFDHADLAIIPEPPLMEKIPPAERFSSQGLVRGLGERGIKALYYPDTDQLLGGVMAQVRPGDVVLFMSNGGFDNLPRRLFKGLDFRTS